MKTLILAAALVAVLPATGWSQVVIDQQHTNVRTSSQSRSSVANSQPVTLNQGNNSPTTNNLPGIAPTIYAPSIVTGNVCAIGASGGISFIGTGITAGATWESKKCEDRQNVALLYNMGEKGAAREYACSANRATYDAMKTAGTPCAVRPDWEPKQTVSAVQPVQAVMVSKDPPGCGMVTLPNGQQSYICR